MKKIKIFVCTGIANNIFAKSNFTLVSNIDEAHVVVAYKIELLQPHINKYANTKSYLLYVLEPQFDTLLKNQTSKVKVHVMSYRTNDVELYNYSKIGRSKKTHRFMQ